MLAYSKMMSWLLVVRVGACVVVLSLFSGKYDVQPVGVRVGVRVYSTVVQ